MIKHSLARFWLWAAYRKGLWLIPLYPLGWLFSLLVRVRRWVFLSGLKKATRFSVPVIVVGNITLGGTGKTPVVQWLARFLSDKGYRVGVLSRGYGAEIIAPREVSPADTPADVGDEPCLLARTLSCPVVVSPDRVAGARYLRNQHHVDIILLDDGLQHYRLARDIEIVVIDAQRALGNRQCLPAGPLREPAARLHSVDYTVWNGSQSEASYAFELAPEYCWRLSDASEQRSLSDFAGQAVSAVAGIGHPARFFQTLEANGIIVQPHPFADHHVFTREDFDALPQNMPIFMTEKDAVKCHGLGLDAWVVSVVPQGLDALGYEILEQVKKLKSDG